MENGKKNGGEMLHIREGGEMGEMVTNSKINIELKRKSPKYWGFQGTGSNDGKITKHIGKVSIYICNLVNKSS